jgi:hypothetical protein
VNGVDEIFATFRNVLLNPHCEAACGESRMSSIVSIDPLSVELRPAPLPPEWVIAGAPSPSSEVIARSADGACSTVVWATTPGTFRFHFVLEETIHILEGELFVSDDAPGAPERRLGPGDTAYFPAGVWQVWRVTKPFRKIAVCRHSMPYAAGLLARAWTRVWPSVSKRVDRLRADRDVAQSTAA